MLVQDYGFQSFSADGLPKRRNARYKEHKAVFSDSLEGVCAENERQREKEDWEKRLHRLDEELQETRRQNKREQERLQEERIRKRRIQKKIWEKTALKKYLARQDETEQLNEKFALERATGKDVYIEKAPLRKTLSLAEIRAICSET